MKTDIITIDGPTSSGKSTVGFLFSKQIGYNYVDTSNMNIEQAVKSLLQWFNK